MGMSAFTKFYFRPGEGERVETAVHLEPDRRSSIHGVVRETHDGRPIVDALVMLLAAGGHDDPAPVGQTFTDDAGQFVFGPLTAGRLYLVKVYKNAVKLRELEIVAEGPEPAAAEA
jgi:hypothetical protein